MSVSDKIGEIRDKIDNVDDRMLSLLAERAELALEMKQAKGTIDIYSPGRESDILGRISKQNKSKFHNDTVRVIYSEIIGACRNLEKQLRISYLGPEGTYSHEAALGMFGSTSKYVPYLSLAEVLRSAETGHTDIAFLPVENSSEGAVIETHRLLLNTPLCISGEFTLPVQHCLLSKSETLDDIKVVHAHPQSLGQCREWLQINMPNVRLISEPSNSQAAKIAALETKSAAIASQQAAIYTNMPVLIKGINDLANNNTRFIALSKFASSPTINDKTSIICSVGDKVGALYELLGILARQNVSLTRLESQPEPDHMYVFYIDFEGHCNSPSIARALKELSREAKTCKILGSYPQGN